MNQHPNALAIAQEILLGNPGEDSSSQLARAYVDLIEENVKLRDKALRFDLDSLGVTVREREAEELVERRADPTLCSSWRPGQPRDVLCEFPSCQACHWRPEYLMSWPAIIEGLRRAALLSKTATPEQIVDHLRNVAASYGASEKRRTQMLSRIKIYASKLPGYYGETGDLIRHNILDILALETESES